MTADPTDRSGNTDILEVYHVNGDNRDDMYLSFDDKSRDYEIDIEARLQFKSVDGDSLIRYYRDLIKILVKSDRHPHTPEDVVNIIHDDLLRILDVESVFVELKSTSSNKHVRVGGVT